MATETHDYAAAMAFIERAKLRDCFIPAPHTPPWLGPTVPYLGMGLRPDAPPPAPGELPTFQVWASGWGQIEGVLIATPEVDFDADLKACVAATDERALRDLLLAFPRGALGLFYFGSAWMLPTFQELFDGEPMPAREGYVATAATFAPDRSVPARQLVAPNDPVVQRQWGAAVWAEMLADQYGVYAAEDAGGVGALCFHWPVSDERHEVHGLQAVRNWTERAAHSAFSAATDAVVARGLVATTTVVRSDEAAFRQLLRELGYQPFYQVHSFLGVKRGSGVFAGVDRDRFYATPRAGQPTRTRPPASSGTIAKSKDPRVVQFRDLAHAAGRRERGQCIIEGRTLAQRALNDGLPVERLLYTRELARTPEGLALLHSAHQLGVPHDLVTEGLLSLVTTTRPVPPVLAAVAVQVQPADALAARPHGVLLVADDVQNPENLGMLLRTADAAGASAVVVAGAQADPLHKLCVRAARGAVGRLPLFATATLPDWLDALRGASAHVLGATAHARASIFATPLAAPLAVVVGNEQNGISPAALARCTAQVQIPMAPGQSSLNVGVAAGVLLFEAVRRQLQRHEA